MIVRLAIVALVLVFGGVTVSWADDVSQSPEIDAIIAQVDQAGSAACDEMHSSRLTADSTVVDSNAVKVKTLNFVTEAIRLECRALHLRDSAQELTKERQDLEAAIQALDDSWQQAHLAAPDKYPDYPGRDRSQKIMQHDVEALAATIANLDEGSADLTRESRRIFVLSASTVKDLSPEGVGVVLVAIDAQAQNDILKRLLGLGPVAKS